MVTAQVAEMYAIAHPDYYEPLDRLADEDSRFELELPDGWTRRHEGLWTVLRPSGVTLPEQGWKIHVSASAGEAAEVLRLVAGICRERRVVFKFLRSGRALRYANAKYADRGSSGKFITAYSRTEEELTALVTDLERALDGHSGPYILSDLRIGAGPVHVRYGAFIEQWCTNERGQKVHALRDSEGRLVPDRRSPSFRLPEWVRPPEVLLSHLALRSAAGALDLPYRVLRPLHYTNAGGTYLAEHRETGERVVLREARPHSGLDGGGVDAITRLRHEHEVLTELSGVDGVPRVFGLLRSWEHEFLVEEYIDGQDLLTASITTNPIGLREPSPSSVAAYVAWVDGIIRGVGDVLDALHARGISFGDLHASNVIVRPGGSVTLIDFEYAGREGHPRAGAPGLIAPAGTDRITADRFALRRLWLMLLLPFVELIEFDPGKEATLEAVAGELFGPVTGPEKPTLPAYGVKTAEPTVQRLFTALDWEPIRDALAAGILGSATPDRDDRLFPAAPDVFAAQGFALAHGAAGVLLALHRAGIPVPPEHVGWLIASTQRAYVAGRARPGLLDGLAGVAVALRELGRDAEAGELAEHLRTLPPAELSDVASGQAGIALTLLHFGFVEDAAAAAWRLDRSADRPEAAGLLRGLTGVALLHLRLFRVTGDEAHLDACRRALTVELSKCVPMPDGTVQVRSGSRHLLYLEGGSGGIALVAQDYLAHRDDPELAAFVRGVAWGNRPAFVREPGLFQGRAGMAATLARLGDDHAADQVRRLAWHTVGRDGTLLIPGARLRRVSADLATGSAGVLAAIQAALADGPFPIPALFDEGGC